MRVAFDDQIFTARPHGGIGRYFAEVIRELNSDDRLGVEPIVDARWSLNPQLVACGMSSVPHVPVIGARVPVMRFANRLRPKSVPDVTHNTFFEPAYLKRTDRGRRVVTVYDMIPELMPELFPERNPHLAKREFVAAADHVICISQATARDLSAIYGDLGKPVDVVHLGVGAPFVPGLPALDELPEQYFLFVGQRGGYKDFDVALRAFNTVADELPHSLVAVGGGAFTERERAAQRAAGVAERVVQVALDDDQLARAYAGATCFVFTSRYEGFGLPTLEAMACGTPVILVNSSSHPEAGGSAASYFEPGDDAQLARQLIEIAGDPSLRSRLAELSIAHAKTMTWRRTAERHAEIYRGLSES